MSEGLGDHTWLRMRATPVPVRITSLAAAHISSQRCELQDTPPRSLTFSKNRIYQAEALQVMLPAANWIVSPLATPVMLLVSAPCR